MGLNKRTKFLLLMRGTRSAQLEQATTEYAAMAHVETDLKLRELCERASKEYDHEKLIDLINQINDLLDQKQRESDPEDDRRKAAAALATFFGSPRDRWLREWLEYQPLFIALAS